MGNSGSTHNLHVERSTSELNSYLQAHSQPLRRTSHRQYQFASSSKNGKTSPNTQTHSYTADWRRSNGFNRSSKSDLETNPQFKVLPKLDERLHLRPTSNGAILNSGGTISGRKNELHLQNSAPLPMQRSRTFILEPIKDADNRSSSNMEFTRSQTLLHVKVKGDKPNSNSSQNNLKQMQRYTYSEPDFMKQLTNESKTDDTSFLEAFAKPGKPNKYHKKRRAPEAPSLAVLPRAPPPELPVAKKEAPPLGMSYLRQTSAGMGKQQLFTKNSDRASKVLISKSNLQSAQNQNQAFQRGNVERKSLSSSNQAQERSKEPPVVLRREKSSDAIMFKSRKAPEPAPEKKQPQERPSNQPHRYSLQIPLESFKSPPEKEKPEPVKATKIPQLKRTFYFGMDLATSDQPSEEVVKSVQSAEPKRSSHSNSSAPENKPVPDTSTTAFMSMYNIGYEKSRKDQEEDIEDNGLRVRIRPTLPRRQLDTPSFSPAQAWRNLVEEQERLERVPINVYRRSQPEVLAHSMPAMRNDLLNWTESANQESPIQPRRTPRIRPAPKTSPLTKTWTPEQDLDEENDGALAAEDDSSSDEYRSKEEDGFLFYGSKGKKSGQDIATSPVHLFSLSLPRDAHLQQHMETLKADDVCIYKSLQKSKPAYYFNKRSTNAPQSSGNNVKSNNISVTKFDGSNNWMLHKNVSSMELRTKSLESTEERHGLPSIEPQSLKLLTGGKHVMYLPGNYEQSSSLLRTVQGEAKTEVQPKIGPSRHFKNRQRIVPESLQDKIPIFPIMSYNERSKVEEEKPFHQRFSFQNPVRLLERKLLPERSLKDTEIEKARRISELEALKRVEEDFQRKRANEKENIRYQLRLHFGNEGQERQERYHSLPIGPVDSFSANDSNNNLFCRDDPEGCVSNSPFSGPDADECRTKYGAKDN